MVWSRCHAHSCLILGVVIILSCVYFLLFSKNQPTKLCKITSSSPRPLPSPGPNANHTRLMILVLSKVKGKENRDVIRETWMKKYRERTSEVILKFSIGTEGLSSLDVENLISESTTYDDLLLLPHLHDTYNNLTRKMLQSFVAIDKRYHFSYILKCDDDSFVVLDTILRELKQRRSNRNYYWGYHFERANVEKEGKRAEHKWFLCDTYFPYAAGGGYILSQDLVRRIVNSSDGLVMYNNEDISIGIWISPYDIERNHDKRFNTYPSSSSCSDSQIVLAERRKEQMFAMQRLLDDHQDFCASQT